MFFPVKKKKDNNKDEPYVGLIDNTFRHDTMAIHTASEMEIQECHNFEQVHLNIKRCKIHYSLKWQILDEGKAYQPPG